MPKNMESVSILYTSEFLQNGLPTHPHTYTYNFKRLRHKRRASYFSIFCVNNTANITDTQKDMDTNDAMEEATTTTTSSSISQKCDGINQTTTKAAVSMLRNNT